VRLVARRRSDHSFTRTLWWVVLYLVVLYVALRWGGGGHPQNLLPSAD